MSQGRSYVVQTHVHESEQLHHAFVLTKILTTFEKKLVLYIQHNKGGNNVGLII